MECVFLYILTMSITASLLVVAVLTLRLLLKKAPKALFCILWGFVAIRLIFPILLESPFSLIPKSLTASDTVLSDAGSVQETYPSMTALPDTERRLTTVSDAAEILLPDRINTISPEHEVSSATAKTTVQTLPGSIPASDCTDMVNTVFHRCISVASVLWPLGVLGMLFYAGISFLRIHKKVKEAVLLNDNIWLCDHVGSPFILGVFRPRIILPSSIQPVEMQYVIAHEKAHLKRLDHFWKPLGFLLLSVYWFNPVLWIAYLFLCKDIELACDERVLRKMDAEDIKSYSSTLLNYSISRKLVSVCPLAFGEVHVQKRIKNALHYKRPTFWIVLLAVLSCAVVAVCFLTNPVEKKEETTNQRMHSDNAQPANGKYTQLAVSQGNQLSDTVATQKNTNLLSEQCTRSTPMPRPFVWLNLFYNHQKQTDGMIVVELPEFPGITFYADSQKIYADTPKGQQTLISGNTIWTTYLADLNNDTYPEICSTVSTASNSSDLSIIIYDFKNQNTYELRDSERYDYALFGNYNSMFMQKIDRSNIEPIFVGELSLTTVPEQDTATLTLTEVPYATCHSPWLADNQLDLLGYCNLYADLVLEQNGRAASILYPICNINAQEDWEAFTNAYPEVLVWQGNQVYSIEEAFREDIAFCTEKYQSTDQCPTFYLSSHGLSLGTSSTQYRLGFSELQKKQEIPVFPKYPMLKAY